MKIRILKGCSGRTFSYRQQEVVDVSETLGRDLVDGKLAEEIKQAEPKKKAGAKIDVDTK